MLDSSVSVPSVGVMETNKKRQRLTREIQSIKDKVDRLNRTLKIKQRALDYPELLPSLKIQKKW